MPFRFFIVSFLIFLGGVLSIPAAIAVWQEREIQDEDAFVQNLQDVTNDEDVQVVLAARLTDRIMTRTDLQARISEGLANLEERADSDAAQRPSPSGGAAHAAGEGDNKPDLSRHPEIRCLRCDSGNRRSCYTSGSDGGRQNR